MNFKTITLPVILATGFLPAEILIQRNGVFLDHAQIRNREVKGEVLAPKSDPVGDDLVLFRNGDLMHGTFGAIDGGLVWNRTDLERPIKFPLANVQQVVFKGAKQLPLSEKTSYVTLVNGDRVPGEIVSLNDQGLTLESPMLGTVTLSRTHLKSVSPNPFDGQLFYAGPYQSDGWVTLEPVVAKPKEKADPEETEEAPEKVEEKKIEEPESSSWVHSGDSFYSLSSNPLLFPDAQLPDVGRIRFQIAWRGRLNISLSLFGDLIRKEPVEKAEGEENAEEEAEKAEEVEEVKPALGEKNLRDLIKGEGFQAIPWIDQSQNHHALIFGSSYTLTLYSSYPQLIRNTFSETGTPQSGRMDSTRSNVTLGESGSTEIELRFDRSQSLIMFYIGGSYVTQWNDLSGFPSDGRALGFINNTQGANVRISDLLITSWNGVTDTAQSMSHPDRDVILMTNGTDRFSGELISIQNGRAVLKTKFQEFSVPVVDLAEVTFRSSGGLDLEDADVASRYRWETEPATLVYRPYGKIQVIPESANQTEIMGSSPFLGSIKANLEGATLLRFIQRSPDITDWFNDF